MSDHLDIKHGIDINGNHYTRKVKREVAFGALRNSSALRVNAPTPVESAPTPEGTPVSPQHPRLLIELQIRAREGWADDEAGNLKFTSKAAALVVLREDEEVHDALAETADGTWGEVTTLLPQGRWILVEDHEGNLSISVDEDGEWLRICQEITEEEEAHCNPVVPFTPPSDRYLHGSRPARNTTTGDLVRIDGEWGRVDRMDNDGSTVTFTLTAPDGVGSREVSVPRTALVIYGYEEPTPS